MLGRLFALLSDSFGKFLTRSQLFRPRNPEIPRRKNRQPNPHLIKRTLGNQTLSVIYKQKDKAQLGSLLRLILLLFPLKNCTFFLINLNSLKSCPNNIFHKFSPLAIDSPAFPLRSCPKVPFIQIISLLFGAGSWYFLHTTQKRYFS